MQTQTCTLFGSVRRYVATVLLLFVWMSGEAQTFQPTLIGTWQGVIFSPSVPAANGATVQCVFSANGEYTCMVSKPGVGMVRHWGRYRAMAREVDFEIKGHEPDSVTMPPSDHMEILSLTTHSLKTRAWAMGSFAYTNFRRVE